MGDNRDKFKMGMHKLKCETDIVDIIKSIRELKLLTKSMLETHQMEVLKFSKASLLDPSITPELPESLKTPKIPKNGRSIVKSQEAHKILATKMAKNFDRGRFSNKDQILLKETLGI